MANLHWKEIDEMAEINLWGLIVVKLSELGILKRYIIHTHAQMLRCSVPMEHWVFAFSQIVVVSGAITRSA